MPIVHDFYDIATFRLRLTKHLIEKFAETTCFQLHCEALGRLPAG